MVEGEGCSMSWCSEWGNKWMVDKMAMEYGLD